MTVIYNPRSTLLVISKRSEKNPTDAHVGSKVRMRRMMIGMSQEKLGDALGITFQQVQKYEKGTNRVGASRLQHISQVLQVPIGFFFEGLLSEAQTQAGLSGTAELSALNELMASRDGIVLARSFMKIRNVELRRRIVALVEDLS
jgi:transcriptional regulator with XRE-family HTH domain